MRCKAPLTVDRSGGDCADPTCQAHEHNEDGPYRARTTLLCGCDGAATEHTCRQLGECTGLPIGPAGETVHHSWCPVHG